jgi:RNA polymerase sigma factor (sigma-70 family)
LSSNHPDIITLIGQCRQGSRKAQYDMYNRYYKAMYNTALRIVKDPHWAEDIMQEAFLKAFTKLDAYRGEVAFGAWLKKIVVNHSLDNYKKVHKVVMTPIEDELYRVPDDGDSDFEIANLQNLKIQQVRQAIGALKENYRIILTLLYIEGFCTEEICGIMNITDGNCRTMISRARESLLKKLKENE